MEYAWCLSSIDFRAWANSSQICRNAKRSYVNSFAPQRCRCDFECLIFNRNLINYIWNISSQIFFKWMAQDHIDDESILVLVLAWGHQATRHYMTQYCPRSILPYGIIRPQLVESHIGKNTYLGLLEILTLYVLNFFRGRIYIYLHFMSLLHIDVTQVLEILPQVRPVPIYSTQSISLLLMSWRRKEPGHQQPWYWPS